MKRVAMIVGLSFFMALPSWLMAQNRGEFGIYGDYFRFAPGNASVNFVGVGGRVEFNLTSLIGLEAEMNYDFAQNYTSTTGTGVTTAFSSSSIRPLSALVGPRFQFGTGAFRPFVTAKIGVMEFSASGPVPVTGTSFSNTVSGIGGSGTYFTVYPGAGVEGFFGPIGLRADVGEEVYMNNGAYNNLRATIGPEFRF